MSGKYPTGTMRRLRPGKKNPLTRKEAARSLGFAKQDMRIAHGYLKSGHPSAPKFAAMRSFSGFGIASTVLEHAKSGKDTERAAKYIHASLKQGGKALRKIKPNPRTRKNPILATLGIAANPQQGLNIPFRAGQKVKVEAVRKWLAGIPDANTRHALTNRFEANIKQYKRFHLGSAPKDFTFQQIPLGTNTRITDVDFVTSEGKEWAASYQVPPHSAKYAKDSQGRYLHAHGDSGIDIKNIKKPANPKILPERFHTADGKFVGVIPKHQKITDWYRF
jgi:hypothetical protein